MLIKMYKKIVLLTNLINATKCLRSVYYFIFISRVHFSQTNSAEVSLKSAYVAHFLCFPSIKLHGLLNENNYKTYHDTMNIIVKLEKKTYLSDYMSQCPNHGAKK